MQVVLELIREAGWTPHLQAVDFGGRTVWICPISSQIFTSAKCDTTTGQMFQPCYSSDMLAALEGLEVATGEK